MELPASQLESIRFKLMQTIQSIRELQITIHADNQPYMIPWYAHNCGRVVRGTNWHEQAGFVVQIQCDTIPDPLLDALSVQCDPKCSN
jgi:hypothetical protein